MQRPQSHAIKDLAKKVAQAILENHEIHHKTKGSHQ
jgi:hypothetical protein